jgi:tetratricopeptide (TPR) repeat protein
MYYKKALKIYDKIGHLSDRAIGFNDIGLIHQSDGNNSKALRYFNRALENFDRVNLMNKLIILSNIGEFYESQKNYSQLLSYFEKEINLSTDIQMDKNLIYIIEDIEQHLNKIRRILEDYTLTKYLLIELLFPIYSNL